MRRLDTLIPIAEGASGRVYRSRDRETGQVLAVKRLRHTDASQVTRLRREAAAQQRLDHPNICRVFGIEHDEQGHVQLLMEFVPGSTLAREMDRLSLDERVRILAKVAEAVDIAHEHGILHRDLKPSNILLRAGDNDLALEPVVADFGLARSADDPAMTATGELLGTPAYMAPEQALGAREQIGPPTDVFSLGCMLYEALTGKPPFEAPTVSASLDRLLHEDPPHPRKINPTAPQALCRIALHCLEREPARRYTHARDLLADLTRWQQGQSVQARHYSRLYRWRRRMTRRPAMSAAALAGVLAIVVLSGWGLWQASTAAARETLAAELGTTLSDIRNRMHIARMAPMHDIGRDREALAQRLEKLAAAYDDRARFADLVETNLARAYLLIGEVDRAAVHARRARGVTDNDAARAVWADVLLARYAEALVPIMELPADRRAERLADAKAAFLEPAEEILQAIENPALQAVDSLARLAILERRFDSARELLGRMTSTRPYDYERSLLSARLNLEQAAVALEAARRQEAAGRFVEAQSQFQRIAETARSDPRPRLLACRAARGRLRAVRHQAETLPETLADLEPLCAELDRVDPGRSSTHAARAAALAAMAAAWDAINEPERARELLRQGIAAGDRGARLAPDDLTLLEFTSRLHLRLAGLLADDFEAAQAAFDRAAAAARELMRIEPDNPVGPMLLGTVERDRARRLALSHRDPQAAFAAAAVAFDRALALDPEAPAILGEASLNEIFRFYELRPSDPAAATERAHAAIALQQRALKQDPDNVDLLFDQGANYGDLWYHLALHPAIAPEIDRGALKQRALDTLARIHSLAPLQPSGYTQPVMILLSDAELRLSRDQPALAPIERALALLESARSRDIAIDRDLNTWLQVTRVRAALAGDGDAAAALEAAWASVEQADVDRSDRFYRELYVLELIGLEARWREQSGRDYDPRQLERGIATLDDLLDRGRRQAVVLCNGARVLLHAAVHADRAPLKSQRAGRAARLFGECLGADGDLLGRFAEDIELLRTHLEQPVSLPAADSDAATEAIP